MLSLSISLSIPLYSFCVSPHIYLYTHIHSLLPAPLYLSILLVFLFASLLTPVFLLQTTTKRDSLQRAIPMHMQARTCLPSVLHLCSSSGKSSQSILSYKRRQFPPNVFPIRWPRNRTGIGIARTVSPGTDGNTRTIAPGTEAGTATALLELR